jgi:hypothetical protein
MALNCLGGSRSEIFKLFALGHSSSGRDSSNSANISYAYFGQISHFSAMTRHANSRVRKNMGRQKAARARHLWFAK